MVLKMRAGAEAVSRRGLGRGSQIMRWSKISVLCRQYAGREHGVFREIDTRDSGLKWWQLTRSTLIIPAPRLHAVTGRHVSARWSARREQAKSRSHPTGSTAIKLGAGTRIADDVRLHNVLSNCWPDA